MPEKEIHPEFGQSPRNLETQELKIPAPEYVPYVVQGLPSVECRDGLCTMTEDDFRQNQTDKRNLLELYKLSHEKDVYRVRAHNSLVDAMMHEQYASERKDYAVRELQTALDKERTRSTVEKWVERVLFIAGILVVGTIAR